MRCAREDTLPAADYIAVLGETSLGARRPLGNAERIRAMLAGADLIVTARDEDGTLAGLARCLSDGAWVCYCAELAVRESYQGKGIGKAILDKAAEILGPGVAITLLAYPDAAGFYERIGMRPAQAFYRERLDSL